MNRSVTITLGEEQASLDARLESGAYDSPSEVVRAALRALDREEQAVNELMRTKIGESLDDPRPDIGSDEVAEHMRKLHANYLASRAGEA